MSIASVLILVAVIGGALLAQAIFGLSNIVVVAFLFGFAIGALVMMFHALVIFGKST